VRRGVPVDDFLTAGVEGPSRGSVPSMRVRAKESPMYSDALIESAGKAYLELCKRCAVKVTPFWAFLDYYAYGVRVKPVAHAAGRRGRGGRRWSL
jgi:hypothetical protein